jgi:hypothetical protein
MGDTPDYSLPFECCGFTFVQLRMLGLTFLMWVSAGIVMAGGYSDGTTAVSASTFDFNQFFLYVGAFSLYCGIWGMLTAKLERKLLLHIWIGHTIVGALVALVGFIVLVTSDIFIPGGDYVRTFVLFLLFVLCGLNARNWLSREEIELDVCECGCCNYGA